jgi:hypothetical protein
MKPETTAFLQKAREFLAKAQGLFDAHHWPDKAGRASYLARFHAAQAFIFESFLADIKSFYAATRCLEIISEASRRLSPAFKEQFPEIP